MLDVCLLGCGGMMPLPGRWLTSLIVSYNGNKLLIDCGEGTQIPLKQLGWGMKSINTICFTHYHADHIAGLPGLLLTLGNCDRTEPLNLIGLPGLYQIVKGLLVIAPNLPYSINCVELPDDKEHLIKIDDFIIKSMPVEHNIPCLAYSIEIERKRKFDPDKARELNIPVTLWSKLQTEGTVLFEGKAYTPDMVLGNPRKGIKLTYCTDSRPVEGLVSFAKNSDLFICEGMHGEDEKLPKAIEHKHMLFSEAASLALKAEVKNLWLTHYSPSLLNPDEFLPNATNIFENTIAGKDGMTTSLKFED